MQFQGNPWIKLIRTLKVPLRLHPTKQKLTTFGIIYTEEKVGGYVHVIERWIKKCQLDTSISSSSRKIFWEESVSEDVNPKKITVMQNILSETATANLLRKDSSVFLRTLGKAILQSTWEQWFPLINIWLRVHPFSTCASQGVRNVSFLKHFTEYELDDPLDLPRRWRSSGVRFLKLLKTSVFNKNFFRYFRTKMQINNTLLEGNTTMWCQVKHLQINKCFHL